nr:zinc finger BED domain-containing protein RICESLEEPER 2 [Tanacetum cinerariifolium]
MDDISSLLTNHESFSSQQNYTMEDDTTYLDGVDLGSGLNHDKDIEKNDKKSKRKAPSNMNKHYVICDKNPANEEDDDWIMHKRIINFRPFHSHRGVDIGRALLECINGWGIKNVMTMMVDNIAPNDKALEYLLENFPTKYDDDPTMKSKIIGYGFKHLIDNGCIPMEVDEESEETPILFLTNDELCDKLVKKVENDMRVLFAMHKEKYGTNLSSDIPKSTSSQSTTTTRRRGNAFKDKVGNKLIGGEDELTKYLKEPRLELEDDEDFDILNWWKLNSPRFPIV